MDNNDLVRFGVSMSQDLIDRFDDWCKEVGYGNRSKAIRDLVRKALLASDQMRADQPVAGTIVMVYDHHVNDLTTQLTELQHDYHHDIVSTMHIHLNHNQCLEIIVVRGILARLRELSQRIQVLYGVLFAELSVTHIDPDDSARNGHDAEMAGGSTPIGQSVTGGQSATAPIAKRPVLEFDTQREYVFDQMAQEWDQMAGKPNREQLQQLIALAMVKGKTVLDLGAGTGVLVEAGLAAQPARWIACDLSQEMLKLLQEKHPTNPVLECLHADVHVLPIEDEAVDRIICHQAFPHFHTPSLALREMNRVLKPGGLLILNHFAGRDFINNIHRNAQHDILAQDLLKPAETISTWLREAGFAVVSAVDETNVYQIIAVKTLI